MAKEPQEFDLYDFDKTIYAGDSALDFYIFCLRKKPSLLIYLPAQLWHLIVYGFKIESRADFKSHFFSFLRGLDDLGEYLDKFWEIHFKNIKGWYRDIDHSRDIVISASPEFLLYPPFKRLGAHTLIATKMDNKTGQVLGKNCYGEEKLVRLRQAFGDPIIRKAYADSPSDMPVVRLAKEQYLVKGNKITLLNSL